MLESIEDQQLEIQLKKFTKSVNTKYMKIMILKQTAMIQVNHVRQKKFDIFYHFSLSRNSGIIKSYQTKLILVIDFTKDKLFVSMCHIQVSQRSCKNINIQILFPVSKLVQAWLQLKMKI